MTEFNYAAALYESRLRIGHAARRASLLGTLGNVAEVSPPAPMGRDAHRPLLATVEIRAQAEIDTYTTPHAA